MTPRQTKQIGAILILVVALVQCHLGDDERGSGDGCDVVYASVGYVDLNAPSEIGAVGLAGDCHHIHVAGRLTTTPYVYKISKAAHVIEYAVVDYPITQMVLVGDHLWAVGGDAVQKIDKGTLTVEWSDNDSTAYDDLRALVYDGTYLWAADRGAAQRLHRIDPADNSVVSYPGIVGAGARHFAFDGAYLWLTCSSANSVIRINPADRSFDSIPTPGTPWGICYDGSSIIVAGRTGRLSKIDPTTMSEIATNTISGASWLCHCVFDGVEVWIADNTVGEVRIVDPATLTAVGQHISLGKAIFSLYDGSYVWTVSEDSLRVSRL